MTAEHARRTARNAATAGALSAVRADLEHRPRDPFTVGTGAALDALRVTWGEAYLIWHEDGQWCARSRGDARILLTCETPDELVRAMRGWGGSR